MADVAKIAGVSHQTVSRVLNDSPMVREETRERVLAAIGELGYRRNQAARMLATNRSGRIGMVAAQLALHGPSMIANAVQEAAHEAGYEVSLLSLADYTDGALAGAVGRLLDQAAEAVVVAVAHRNAGPEVRALSLPVPVVVVQGVTGDEPYAAAIDQMAGARLATDHLLDLGHRRVAHVSGPWDWVEAWQRREGWRASHRDRGLLPGAEIEGDWSPRSGYEAGVRIAADTDTTAVFAANDAMALGVMQALHEAGRRVPEDVSVVGFDDVPEAAFYWPSLTTVSQEFSALGRRAVAIAVSALAGEDEVPHDLLQPVLVTRASSGPVNVHRRG